LDKRIFEFLETKLIFDPGPEEEVEGIEYVVVPCHCVQTRPVNRADIQGVQEYNIHEGSNIDRIICPSREN
jgi:hypothetical protein